MDGDDGTQDWTEGWSWPRTVIDDSNVSRVYRAISSQSGKTVAIKEATCNHPWVSKQNRAEFIRCEEAALRSCRPTPHVVRLLDAKGVDLDRKLMFEWIEGRMVESVRHFSFTEAVERFREMCEGIVCIHAGGYLHSDICPQNTMVKDGHAVVIDLGFAYPLHSRVTFTTGGGRRGYIAPERERLRPATTASDVYSLGVTLYYLVRGAHAFNDAMSDRERVNTGAMPAHIDHVPDWVNQVIRKATSHTPKDRFQTVEELAAALPAK